MNIGITGGNGFLGSYVVRQLQEEGIDFSLFDKKEYNLLEQDTLQKFVHDKDVIIHLAGLSRKSDLYDMLRVNILGTENIAAAIAKYNPGISLLFASSTQANYIDDAYGSSKKIGEDIVEYYAHKNLLRGVVLRFCNIYGVGARPNYNSAINTFAHRIKSNQTLVINGDGMQLRDYINVKDAARAISHALQHSSGKFNKFTVCSNILISINDVIKVFERQTKQKINIQYNPISTDNKKPPRYTEVKMLPGWEPSVTIEDGIKEIIEYEN